MDVEDCKKESKDGRSPKRKCVCRWDFRQLGTTTAGIFIFLSAGMNFAQGFGWSFINKHQFRYNWFLGVIAGTILALILKQFVLEKLIMAFSSALILCEGIIYVSAHDIKHALLAGRYLNGFAIGLATLTFLIHASEISLHSHRGVLLGIEHYSLAVGVSLQMIYSTKWNTFPAIRLHGILDTLLGLFALASTLIFVESPIRYFRKGRDAEALQCLDRLHACQGWTVTTNIIFNDMRDYVRQQLELPWLECMRQSVAPFVKMLFFRSMLLAFCFCLPLCTLLQYSTTIMWPQIVAACLRIFGCFLAHSLVDNFGRKLPSLVSSAGIGCLLLSIALICRSDDHIFDSYKKYIVATLCLLTQFFAGLFSPFTSVYLAEAFPLKVKPYLMSVCIIVEQVIHIIVICNYAGVEHDAVLMVEGILTLVAVAGLSVTLPETRKTSLQSAHELSSKWIHLKMYQYY